MMQLSNRPLRSHSGITAVELLAVLAILGVVVFALTAVFPKMGVFFQGSQLQAQQSLEARAAMDTMVHFLAQAKVNSALQYCPCGPKSCAVCVPSSAYTFNSQIDFNTPDNHSRAFYWHTDNTLHMVDNLEDTVICHNVTKVNFDYPDAFSVRIQLELNIPLNASNTKSIAMVLPSQIVALKVN